MPDGTINIVINKHQTTMKKFVLFALMMSAVIMGACTHKTERLNEGINVESTISDDKAYMADNYGPDYKLFETSITLNDYLDTAGCTGAVFGVCNVFQVETGTDDGYNVKMVIITHTHNAMKVEEKSYFCIDDYPLDRVSISYRQAYNQLCKANFPKPHSRQCVLRKQVGSYPCNPQYIFGNANSQVYVDAMTGRVSSINPAFTPPQLE